jgi:hypothetical protein
LPAKNRLENIRLTSKDIAAYCQVSKSTVLESIRTTLKISWKNGISRSRVGRSKLKNSRDIRVVPAGVTSLVCRRRFL